MAITDITKPMALDETLQGTNTKMDAVIQKLQGIIDALGLDTSVYKPKGNITCAALVPALLIDDNLGNVYNVTDNGTTTSDFVEGAGKPIHVGDNVAIVDIGTGGQSEYKFDLLAGMVDLTNYVQKSATPGLLKNDGTVDTKDYAEKVAGATNGNLAGLNGSGNLTDSGWNGAKDTTSISGNPISISGLKANQLAVNPIITLEPIQAGSGTPSPSNNRAISGYDKIEVLSCGVNVWDEETELGYINSDGEYKTATDQIRSKNFIKVSSSITYYAKTTSNALQLRYFDDSENFVGNGSVTNGTFTPPNNATLLKFNFGVAYGVTYNNNISINYPSTDTSYHAYHKATSISESLGQTVYGGTLDVRSGKLVSILKALDMSTMNWQYSSGLQIFYCYVSDIAQSNPMWCSCYNPSVQPITENYTITSRYGYYVENPAIVLKDTRYTDATSLKTALTGQTVVYTVAPPSEIQLTPHEISLLKDNAYVSTNGTNIALDYHNGEMASLGDVSQLGETVNLVGNDVGALTAELKELKTTLNRILWTLATEHPVVNNGTDNGAAKLMLDYSSTTNKITVYKGNTVVGKITLGS